MAPLPRSDSAPYLPHIRTPLDVFALHSLYFYLDMSPPRQPFFRLAQAIFEPHLSPYKYPTNLIPAILPAYTAYEDGTECSETSAYKIQTPGNHPKESIQDINRYFPVLDSRPADILFGHRNYFQRKDYAELREHILCYEHEVLPGHFLSFSSHRIPSLRAIQYIIVLIMYLLLFPTAQNTCTKNRP
jgi:hypothetical protein